MKHFYAGETQRDHNGGGGRVFGGIWESSLTDEVEIYNAIMSDMAKLYSRAVILTSFNRIYQEAP